MNSTKEKELCIALGISRVTIKDMRKDFKEGEDWVRIASKRPKNLWEVKWTDTGVQRLRDKIGMKPAEEIEAPMEHKGVVKHRFKNLKFIQAEINGTLVNVVCRDNQKFIAGMPVWARWDGRHWFVSRHPRFNGKY